MKFCCIIPDRGDRPELTAHCLAQLARMTEKPDAVFHINHKPETERVDLIGRVKRGIAQAKAEGFEYVFIIENDDYYPPFYFERYLAEWGNADFIGDDSTTYYNLRNQTHRTFLHKHRSSLFTTAFKISALNLFDWNDLNPETPFLDLKIWEYARHRKRKFVTSGALGVKHGVGLCGGKGHGFKMPNTDPNLVWLKQNVDSGSFEFYNSMVDNLKVTV
jgi:glycosyltransferase involved in cell wall biosynthesis